MKVQVQSIGSDAQPIALADQSSRDIESRFSVNGHSASLGAASHWIGRSLSREYISGEVIRVNRGFEVALVTRARRHRLCCAAFCSVSVRKNRGSSPTVPFTST